MKKILTLFFTILISSFAFSQKISVESFRCLENDINARVSKVRDQNGELCALIIINTPIQGLEFSGCSIEKTDQKTGEIWVFVSPGVKFITLKHRELGSLRNYPFPQSIKEGTTYEMVLKTEEKAPTIDSASMMKAMEQKFLEMEQRLSQNNQQQNTNQSVNNNSQPIRKNYISNLKWNEKLQTDFSFHLGGVFPLGSYAESKDNLNSLQNGNYEIAWNTITDKAGATLGLNLGAKLRFNLPAKKGFGVIATADLFFNPSNKEARDWVEDYMILNTENIGIKNYDISIPKYINIPIMLGLNYEYNIKDNVKIWGEAAVGFNIGIITDYTIDAPEYYYEYYVDYYNHSTLCFQLGVGVLLLEQLSVGLHYYNLGLQYINGFYEYTSPSEYTSSSISASGPVELGMINPNMITLGLGYHF